MTLHVSTLTFVGLTKMQLVITLFEWNNKNQLIEGSFKMLYRTFFENKIYVVINILNYFSLSEMLKNTFLFIEPNDFCCKLLIVIPFQWRPLWSMTIGCSNDESSLENLTLIGSRQSSQFLIGSQETTIFQPMWWQLTWLELNWNVPRLNLSI